MAVPAPTLLRENIFFLIAGTCLSCLLVLFFDTRLYTTKEVFVLFAALFFLFCTQALTSSSFQVLYVRPAALLDGKSFVTVAGVLLAAFAFLFPFPLDVAAPLHVAVLGTLVEASLQFFARYKKQLALSEAGEKFIRQTVRQQVHELEVLKQQIDRHFIFNSFNTLSFLIDENPAKARQFSNKFASVYGYIIFNSGENLVSVWLMKSALPATTPISGR